MRRLTFGIAVGACVSTTAAAQPIPGRDLLQFPIGAIAEAPALAEQSGAGLWNPASLVLPHAVRLRASAAALRTPADVGVEMHLLSAAVRLTSRVAVGASIVRGAVDGIVATDTDPHAIGDELPYHATVVSLGFARRGRAGSAGLAVRYRTGEAAGERRGGVGVDAGVRADQLLGAPVRVAASTFLWRPAAIDSDQAMASLAADVRVAGSDSTAEARLGYSISVTTARAREQYLFGSAQAGRWSLRGGITRSGVFESAWRPRVGIGLAYAGYSIGVAREESGAGLAPVYQFLLSSLIR